MCYTEEIYVKENVRTIWENAKIYYVSEEKHTEKKNEAIFKENGYSFKRAKKIKINRSTICNISYT